MNRLISPEYLALNRALHRDYPDYGATGQRRAMRAAMIAMQYQAKDVLDYGCGKGALRDAFPVAWQKVGGHGAAPAFHCYDPAVPGFDAPPSPRDVVICADVLEHVEPECVDSVLADLARLTKMACYTLISTRPAGKTLSDGRNAHLLVQPPDWWLAEMRKHFAVAQWSSDGAKCELEIELITR